MSAPAFKPVPVLAAWDETPSLRALKLDLNGGLHALHRVPGQAIRLRAPSGKDGFFALATAPSNDGHAELLIKRGGGVADELLAGALPGAAIEASAPTGRGFPVEESVDHDVLLFATGSGISPIRAVVQHLMLTRQPMGRVMLYYGQRTEREFAYAREHHDWQRAGVQVTLVCSQPSEAWRGARGYVQDVARDAGFGGADPARSVAYLCGTKAMIGGVHDTLGAAGFNVQRAFLNF